MKKIIFAFVIALLITVVSVRAQDDPVRAAFSTSYALEKNADYIDAIAQLKKVYDEKSYEINLRLGWLDYEAGYYLEAMSYYQKAINLMPFAIEPRFGFVLPATAVGDMDKVEAQYNKILEVDPQNAIANYNLGLIAFNRKDYKTASNYFSIVVNLYPFDYYSLLKLALTDLQLGNYSKSKILFNKVLLYAPTDTSALNGLSYIK